MATDSAEHSLDPGMADVWLPRDHFDDDDDDEDEDDDDIECSTPQTRGAAFKRKGLFKKTTLPPPPRANAGSSSGYPGVSWNKRMGAWLAFYYDNDTRRSRTFHPKYYDMDVEKAKSAAIDFMKGIEKHPRCSLRKTRREPGGAAAASTMATNTTSSAAAAATTTATNGQVDSVRRLSPTLPSADQLLVHPHLQKHQSSSSTTCATTTPFREIKTGTRSSTRRQGSVLRVKSSLYCNGNDDLMLAQGHKTTTTTTSHVKSPVFDYNVVKRNFMLVNTKALNNAFSTTSTTTGAATTPDSSRRSFCNVEPGQYYDTFDCGNSYNTSLGTIDGADPRCSWPNSRVFLNEYLHPSPQKFALDEQAYLQGHCISNLQQACHPNNNNNPYFDQEYSGGNLYLDQSRSFDLNVHDLKYKEHEDAQAAEIHRLLASEVDSFQGYKHMYGVNSSSPFGSQDIYGSMSFNSSLYQASPCPNTSLVALASTPTSGEANLLHFASMPSFSNFVASNCANVQAQATVAASPRILQDGGGGNNNNHEVTRYGP